MILNPDNWRGQFWHHFLMSFSPSPSSANNETHDLNEYLATNPMVPLKGLKLELKTPPMVTGNHAFKLSIIKMEKI